LHGLSSSDFGPALEQFLGSAAGLSAATITRLTAQWQDDADAFSKRSLKDTDYVYVWVDGIVRHEALCDRAGVEDPRRPVVVATG
jgi:transposase-like protein